MKRVAFLILAVFLTLILCACDPVLDVVSSDVDNTEYVQSEIEEVSIMQDEQQSPEGATDILAANIYYYDLMELQSDAGDGLTPRQGADLVLSDVLYTNELPFSPELGQCIYIAFEALEFVDSEMERECYLYTIATGTVSGGIKGDDYLVQMEAAVDYGGRSAFIYSDYRAEDDGYVEINQGGNSGTEVDENSEEQEEIDSDIEEPRDSMDLKWEGVYIGDYFSVTISNYNGISFDFVFSNLRNGDYFLEGVANLDGENTLLAMYEGSGFYLYEDTESIDFLSSESSEWSHLRDSYSRIG